MLAKGWLLGVQFATLMADGLYWSIARNAIDQAMRLRQGMVDKGYKLYIDSPTNQQFFVIGNDRLAQLQQHIGVDIIEAADQHHTVIRLCTSWATTTEQVDQLLASV